jgi:hypothetical protein
MEDLDNDEIGKVIQQVVEVELQEKYLEEQTYGIVVGYQH